MAFLCQRGKKGTQWIKCYVHRRPVYESLGTTNAHVAERLRRQVEGMQAKGELLALSKTPLPAPLEAYCRFMSTFRTPKSYSTDVSVLRVFFGPICQALELGTCANRRFRDKDAKRVPDRMAHVHVRAFCPTQRGVNFPLL